MFDSPYTNLFIKHFPFWEHLSQKEKELMAENTESVLYKKGEILYGGEEDCAGVIIVETGQLRTYILSEDGRDITLYRLYEDDVCIMSASCVLEAITFHAFVEAVIESNILVINSKVFKDIAKENKHVEGFMYRLATVRFSDVMWSMQQILFMSFDRRLAIFLLEEIEKSNLDEVKFTHEQIAKLMGSAREVVSRMLKYFSDEGIVHLSRGMIKIIDKEKLIKMTKQ
ncbi:MAG TPA: Crp/Fnr family transcriptional regulator [Oscillospiraceae bacterium]|nr:Crp/Fnr family transcriptional regulator [Oscillospiraceae bacterium]